MDPASDSSRDCLCLVCRETGHVVEECPWYTWQLELPGSTLLPGVEPTRPFPPLNPFPTIEGSTQALCQRCSKSDALSKITSYRPLVDEDLDDGHTKRVTKKTTQIPPLGPIKTLQLLSTCPLCRLIFDVTHLEDEEMEVVRSGGELVVVTGWTIHRLERELYWQGCGKGKGPYAKCVYTSVVSEPWEDGVYQPGRVVDEAMDAIGLIDVGESRSNGGLALGVREVDSKTPDYCTIRNWLRRCDDLHHTTCRPFISEGLKQIKLIDVETRQIIMDPPHGCDYIALSYVWGGVEQPSCKLEEILPTVPATLEDAMVVTRNLGKQYLWADSLCIDQENNVERAAQIALMSAIYSGAWATIINLSGQSAWSGLPRVGTLHGVIPQLSCDLWGKRLLSVMPSLSQQISWSPWGSRAWTFQEGMLSPRRLFFTNHQVYFECNSIQCCESLDDSESPFHLPSDEQRQAALDDEVQDPKGMAGVKGIIGHGVLRDRFRPISNVVEAEIDNGDFATYRELVQSYTMKKMSQDADSLNAFSAILTRLADMYYKGGFVQGLPVDDLPMALLWFHSSPPRRRVGFPTWSWAGWDGGVSDIVMHGTEDPYDAIKPPLRVWKSGPDDDLELIYDFNPTPDIIMELERQDEDTDSSEDVEEPDPSPDSEPGYESDEVSEDSDDDGSSEEYLDLGSDPLFQLAKTMLEDTPAALPRIDGNELLIEGIVIRLRFTETPIDHWSDSESDDEHDGRCLIRLDGQPKPQRMKFYGHNAAQLANQRSNNQQEFLLVSRDCDSNSARGIFNALLLIDQDGDVANRIGVADLRLDNVKLLECFHPERRLFRLR